MSAVLKSEVAASGYIEVRRVESLLQPAAGNWGRGLRIPTPMGKEFLAAVEQSGINDITCHYLAFERDGAAVAYANVFVSETDFATFDPKLQPAARLAIKRWFPDFMRFKVVELGYFTMIGEGLAVADEQDLPAVLTALDKELQKLLDEHDAEFIFIRDIPFDKYPSYWRSLKKLGYGPSTGFPNAKLPIKWDSLDAYLAALDSKTRLKFKNSLKLDQYRISVDVIQDYGHLAEDLAILWANVNAKAKDYSREKLTAPFFRACAERLAGRSEVIRFTHEGRMVGFMLNLIGDDDYIVLDWGVDYGFEHYKDANLYRAASVMSVQRSIALGKATMELGITNYTPKLTLGCEIQPLAYFVRHRSKPVYSRTLARMLSDAIVQPDNTEHAAVAKVGALVHDLPAFERQIRHDQNLFKQEDLLSRLGNYQRFNTMRLGGIYGLYPEFNCAQQSTITFSDDNKEVVLLGTNSYLGLGSDPRVVEAAVQALRRYGSGCSGSPLLNGTLDIHNALEHELAAFMGREAVALCSTGYQTNLAALSALCGPGDVVLMDARNHRSLFDGVKLSGADCIVFRHADLAHLEKLLQRTAGKRCLVVTDSLFSMEGTIADLIGITRLAKQYGARVFVDESHAIGVFGATGRGIAELQGVEDDVDIIMGTFSKSFAALGGFVTGKHLLIDYIKHNAGGHIFSASLPPSVIATVRAALRVVIEEPERRQAVLDKARYMAISLAEMGYQTHYHGAQIVPVVFGNYTLALAAYKRFMAHGVYVNPVGPPAVPEQFSGFRTSYIATHRWEDLERALDVFRQHLPDFDFS